MADAKDVHVRLLQWGGGGGWARGLGVRGDEPKKARRAQGSGFRGGVGPEVKLGFTIQKVKHFG